MKNLVKIYTFLGLVIFALSPMVLIAQVDIPTNCGTTTFDFDTFFGAGFTPSPGPTQLDSDTWALSGMSDGNLPFGGTGTSGDYARGNTSGGVTTGGVYSLNGSALWIQPGGSDFTPGTLKLKACNTSGAAIADIDLSYDILYLNDADRANSFNFSYSLDDVSYTAVPALDFTTPEALDANGIVTEPRSTTLSALNIPNGMCVFFAWTGDDVSGGGSRDEYGLDNITFCAAGGVAPPPPPPPAPANPYCIASDDFDSPTNLVSRTVTVDMAFMNNGDLWGVANSYSGDPTNTPFAIIDDSNPACAGFFANDNNGIIPCNYGNQFFGMTDTENPDNMGPVSADWVFDISSAINLTAITIDMGAMGDFETANDNFVWSYSIDGGPSTTIFNMTPDESTDATYVMDDGDVFTYDDPMTVNGTILLNDLTTFTANISGSGSLLTLHVEGMGDGGSEAIAWDNITIKGIPAGVAVPTMGEWAMFLFAIIMLTIGVVFVFNAQQRMALSGAGQASFNLRQLPFDGAVFKTALQHAFGLALVGFVVIFSVWGEIVPADLIGMALSIPVVAYLIHMVKLFGNNK
ncbi:MAG: hypothetical protein R2788_01000 [Saprospiraceae bacterium]